MLVRDGTVNISGGSIQALNRDEWVVDVVSGTVDISGGMFVGDNNVWVRGGMVSIYGCGLELSGGLLTGFLQDGTAISLQTSGTINLVNACLATLTNLTLEFVTDPVAAQGLVDKLNAAAHAPTPQAKAGALKAYVNQVKAQTGKSLTAEEAAILIGLASAL